MLETRERGFSAGLATPVSIANGGTGVTSLSDILGTTNQVTVSGGAARIIGANATLSLPQNIHTAATPQFASLGLNVVASANAGTITATGGANNITLITFKRFTDTAVAGNFLTFQSAAASTLLNIDIRGRLTNYSGSAPTDGQILIGSTAGAIWSAATITGTTNQVTVTNGGNSITLSTPQNTNTTATVQFGSLGLGVAASANVGTLLQTAAANNITFQTLKRFTDTSPTGNFLLFQNAAAGTLFNLDITGKITNYSGSAPTDGQLLIGGTTAGNFTSAVLTAGANVTITNGAGSITIASSTGISGLTANGAVYAASSTTIASTAALTNGQILMGSTGVAPVAATITGTANQVTVTNGAGSITLATPQNIDTAASVRFGKVGIGMAPTYFLDITQSALLTGVTFRSATTQTQVNTTDTGDGVFAITYTFTASSASNHLVSRLLNFTATNNLTGGGAITNLRIIDLVAATNASTTTTTLSSIFIENGTASGTVTTGYGINIQGLQGTTKYGVYDAVTNSRWVNTAGSLELGPGTGTPGTSRFRLNGGTAIATTDWAITSGWGANATISAVSGNDSRGTVTVSTAAPDIPGANPVITLTFKDGTWTTAPFAVANMNSDSLGPLSGASTKTTATTLAITYEGTPSGSPATYIFNYIVEG